MEEEEEVVVEEEEERGAKRATSRFRDCSDTVSELPATCNNRYRRVDE